MITPGEILCEEFLKPLGLSKSTLAKKMGVRTEVVIGILRGRCAITTEIARQLGHALGTSPEFWMNLQTSYDRNVPLHISVVYDLYRRALDRAPVLPGTNKYGPFSPLDRSAEKDASRTEDARALEEGAITPEELRERNAWLNLTGATFDIREATATPGRMLNTIRKLQGMRRRVLSHESGVSELDITRIERGSIPLSEDVACRLAGVLGILPSVLLCRE